MARIVLRACAVVMSAACAWSAVQKPPKVADGALTATATAGSYNVCCDLVRAAPAAAKPNAVIVFGYQDPNDLYFTRLTDGKTGLYRVENGRVHELAESAASLTPASPGESREVVFKRRPGEILVEAEGKTVLHVYDDAFSGGKAGIGAETAGLEVRDLYVQEIANIEFSEDFATGAPGPAAWTPLEGQWRLALRRDPLVTRQGGPIAASWYEADGPTARLSVAGRDFWEDYAVEASVRSEADTWVGIAFCVRDAGNFCAFAFAPTTDQAGVARLLAVEDGRARIISSAAFPAEPGRWYRARVEAFGHSARAMVNGQDVLSAHSPFSSGKIGLWSDGPGVAQFDDVTAQSICVLDEGFDDPRIPAWRLDLGQWRCERGALVSRSRRLNMATTHATFRDFEYAADVRAKPGAEAALVFRHTDESHYEFAVAPRKGGMGWRLSLREGERSSELASGTIGGRSEVASRMRVLAEGGRLACAIDGDVLARVYDFSTRAGRLGLMAQGRGVAFDDVAAHSRPEPTPATISVADGSGMTVPWGPDGSMVPVLGSLWRPRRGSWSAAQLEDGSSVLRPDMNGGGADLWYRDVCPGSPGIAASTDQPAEGGRVEAVICSADGTAGSGYSLAVSDGRFALRRNGVEVGVSALLPRSQQGMCRVTLFRDGAFVVGGANDRWLAYRDDEVLPPGLAGIAVSGRPLAVYRVRLVNYSALAYKFDKVEPDWTPSAGEWVAHSGMACIPWDYWLTGFGRPAAFTWNRHVLPADQVVTVHVSEYTEGEESGHHRHFPYHDVNIVICGQPPDPDSGYRFVIGAEGGRYTRVYRRGKLVMESPDPRFRITMGSHCNSPRAIGVEIRKSGGHLRLFLQGVAALDYQDPDPLMGGHVALGVRGCNVNFRDFVAYAESNE